MKEMNMPQFALERENGSLKYAGIYEGPGAWSKPCLYVVIGCIGIHNQCSYEYNSKWVSSYSTSGDIHFNLKS